MGTGAAGVMHGHGCWPLRAPDRHTQSDQLLDQPVESYGAVLLCTTRTPKTRKVGQKALAWMPSLLLIVQLWPSQEKRWPLPLPFLAKRAFMFSNMLLNDAITDVDLNRKKIALTLALFCITQYPRSFPVAESLVCMACPATE